VSNLIDRVGEAVEECVDNLHDCFLKSRPADAREVASALRDACAGYRDVVEADEGTSA
jgi:hypothetical protein